jgi:hypothetical protein
MLCSISTKTIVLQMNKRIRKVKRLLYKTNFYLILFLIIPCMLNTINPLVASADGLPASEIQALDEYPNWVAGSASTCGETGVSGVTSSGTIATSQTELANAKIIMGIAKTDGIGENGALVGLMVGTDESTLTDLANQNVPLSENNPSKQGDGSNGTSLGVFQQQITDDWSTISSDISNTDAINQLMTPAYSAEAFFGSPSSATGASSALTKGLQDVSGWQAMTPWAAAQAVQHSATSDGSNYERYVKPAQSLLNQYWSSAPAVALPVPIAGSSGGTTTGGSGGEGALGCTSSVACTGSVSSTTTGLSQVRQNIVCVAEQELALWKSGQLKPGTNAYFKYSSNRAEEWCADFASWVYNQAGDPFGPQDSNGSSWDVPYVPNLQAPPQDSSKFTYHALGSYTPQPGDLAIHGSAHVNIVVAVNGSTLTLIGGDQSGDSFPDNIVSEYELTNPSADDPPITGFVSPN